MRNFFTTSLVAFFALTLFFGCEKPEETPAHPAAQKGPFYAKINNRDWDATDYYALKEGDGVKLVGTFNGKTLSFTTAGTSLRAYKVNAITQSTAVFIERDSVKVKYYNSNVDPTLYAGAITITKYDPVNNLVSGTFNLILKDTASQEIISAEDGYFTDIQILDQAFAPIHFMAQQVVDDNSPANLIDVTISASGAINQQTIVQLPERYLKMANSFSTYNSTTKDYLFAFPEGENFITVNGSNVVNKNIPSHFSAPVFVGNSLYAYSVRYLTGNERTFSIYNIDKSTGIKLDTLYTGSQLNSSISWEFGYSSHDGSSAYFLTGDRLFKYVPETKAFSSFVVEKTANSEYCGLECQASNQLLMTYRSGSSLSLRKATLASGTAAFTTLHNFSLNTENQISNIESAYDKNTTTYWLFVYEINAITGVRTTFVHSYNLNTNTSSVSQLPGEIFGVERIN